MWKPKKAEMKEIYDKVVKRWKYRKGYRGVITYKRHKLFVYLPGSNKRDLWIWSASKAGRPKLRGRFYNGKKVL